MLRQGLVSMLTRPSPFPATPSTYSTAACGALALTVIAGLHRCRRTCRAARASGGKACFAPTGVPRTPPCPCVSNFSCWMIHRPPARGTWDRHDQPVRSRRCWPVCDFAGERRLDAVLDVALRDVDRLPAQRPFGPGAAGFNGETRDSANRVRTFVCHGRGERWAVISHVA